MASPVTARLIALAEAQHGVVTRAQLLELGLTAAAIDARLARGTLRLLHRGVYALGHRALTDEGYWLAATLAYGTGIFVSHLTAALLWHMRVPRRARDVIHLTTTRHQRGGAGVQVHRTRRIGAADVIVVRGIPVTTVARTVVDCADLLDYVELRALADHGVRLDADAVRGAQERAPGRRGAGRLNRLLGSGIRTRSELERAIRKLCHRAGLPRPLFNEKVLGYECDAVWPDARLIVEVDGGAFHAQKPAREADYERSVALAVAGWRVVRFTYAQVVFEPRLVATRLHALLRQGVR